MSQLYIVVGITGTVIVLIFLLCITIYALVLVRRINNSFNKLGYMVREDAKKYFDDASNKLIETNRQSHEQYKEIVVDATKSVMIDSGVVMEKAIYDAQTDAGKIIIEAQQTAQRVIVSAKNQAKQQYHQVINDSVRAVDWTMEQYIGSNYTQKDHEDIIMRLLRQYIDERE